MRIVLHRTGPEDDDQPIGLEVGYATNRGTRKKVTFWLTEETASRLAHRLMSFTSQQGPLREEIVEETE